MTHPHRSGRGLAGCRSAVVLLSLLSLYTPLAPGRVQAQERPFPYELTSRDQWLAPVGLVSGMLGLYLASTTEPATLEEIAALDRETVNAFDRGTTYNWSPEWQDRSDIPRNVLLLSSVLLSGAPSVWRGEWSQTMTLATIFLEAASLTTFVTYATKGLASRLRPYTYNTSLTPEERLAVVGPDDPSVRQSLFSGHGSSAFAAATLLSTIYEDMYGRSAMSKVIWVSSLSLATFTAYGRVKGGVHFPTDVLAGAAVGAAIGYLVPRIHRVDAEHGLSISASPGSVQVRLAVGGH